MRHATEIILAPVITEKVGRLMEKANVVAFKVRPDANKIEIRAAVEELLDRGKGKSKDKEKAPVRVLSVRTIRNEGKLKRMGRFVGRRPTWKKAIVTLAPGVTLPELN